MRCDLCGASKGEAAWGRACPSRPYTTRHSRHADLERAFWTEEPSDHELRRRHLAGELIGRPLSRTEGVLLDSLGRVLATKLGTPEARRAHEQFRQLLEEPEVQQLAHAVRRWLKS